MNDFQFDDGDNLWIATDEGLLKLEKEGEQYKSVRKIEISGLNENDPVRAIAIEGEHAFFASTKGLIISKGSEFILFNQDSGLPSKIVKLRGLEFNHDGNLLIATAKGMAVLRKEVIQFRKTISPVFKSIQIKCSLRNLTCSIMCASIASNGTILVRLIMNMRSLNCHSV